MRRVLVTGATGFVGSALCHALANRGYQVRAALRTDRPLPSYIEEKAVVGEIGPMTDWQAALAGVECVIHAAARAHLVNDRGGDAPYFETNALGTRQLAAASAACNVRRFVYVSSVKVNGERTIHKPFGPHDRPDPHDAYGRSKLQGEGHVLATSASSNLEVAIVRPPLVYGPGVRANFAQLIRAVERGWPLPLGAVANARSLVSIWNLIDLLLRALEHPSAAGRVFMVSDGKDLSTPDLLRLIARSLGRPARLVRIPPGALRLAAGIVGAGWQVEKLCSSLQVDISATRRLLDWDPPMSVEESMAQTAAAYLSAGPLV